ncbi:MAG: nuclear transport factor 2 family protein [candidate division Zixibacteria bacterium]
MRSITSLIRSMTSILLAICLIIDCSQSRSSEEIVENYRIALNSHNVDKLMSIYSDDIRFEIPSMRMMLSGKDALRGIAEYDSALKTIMTLTNIRVDGDSVLCEITETNDWMNAAGFSSAHYPQATFVVKDGKISYIGAVISDSSAANFRNTLQSFMPWGNGNYPDVIAEMMPEDKFIFNGKNGATMVRLLREWRAAMESKNAD